jgi:dynein heavy chain
MLAIPPDFVRLGGTGPKVPDFWDKSKKLVKDYKKLIARLENYDKDNINPTIIQKIQTYLDNPNFNPDIIKNASNAAEGICKWVIAICKYDIVYKEIQPKRDALKSAED